MDRETVDSKIRSTCVCVPTRLSWSALQWYTWCVIDDIVSFMDHETVDRKIKSTWSVCIPTRLTWSALQWYTSCVIDDIVSFMDCEMVDSKTKGTCSVCVPTSGHLQCLCAYISLTVVRLICNWWHCKFHGFWKCKSVCVPTKFTCSALQQCAW